MKKLVYFKIKKYLFTNKNTLKKVDKWEKM